MGYPDAAKECLLKRVRALGGAGWQGSREGFATYAGASEALCRAYLQVWRAEGVVLAGIGCWVHMHARCCTCTEPTRRPVMSTC